MTGIVRVGAAGRMGRAVAAALASDRTLTLKACIERPGVDAPGDGAGVAWGYDPAAVVARGDVVVEFATNQRRPMAAACDRFRTGVLEGDLAHDGDPVLVVAPLFCQTGGLAVFQKPPLLLVTLLSLGL